jgi:hypothetical protein
MDMYRTVEDIVSLLAWVPASEVGGYPDDEQAGRISTALRLTAPDRAVY